MKTLNQKLIAAAAAVLMTSASLTTTAFLSMAPQAASAEQSSATEINSIKITNLAPISVRPSAKELRSASLLTDMGTAALVTLPALARLGQGNDTAQLSLLGSQLGMPYYSFGNKFGRISKE
jgi:hypothetical protein